MRIPNTNPLKKCKKKSMKEKYTLLKKMNLESTGYLSYYEIVLRKYCAWVVRVTYMELTFRSVKNTNSK